MPLQENIHKRDPIGRIASRLLRYKIVRSALDNPLTSHVAENIHRAVHKGPLEISPIYRPPHLTNVYSTRVCQISP